MSTKTLRKRIALATVVALGAGVLSLVSTTANAASVNGTTAANDAATVGNANIATVASTTGAAILASGDGSDGRSLGLLSYGDIGGGVTAGTTQTATLLSTGALALYTSAATASSVKWVVSGGYISAATADSTQVNGNLTAAAGEGGYGTSSIVVKPNSGVTSFNVSMYTNSTRETPASILGGTSTGTLTLKGYMTVTVAATSLAGTISAANSGVWYTDYLANGLTSDSSTLASPGTVWAGEAGYANVRIRDAYSAAVTGAGLLQVSATNGAYVKISATSGGTPSTGTTSSDFLSIAAGATADDYVVKVTAPASAPISTVITVSYNGTVIGTKAFTITGQVAKITLSSPVNGKTSNSTGNTATIQFFDAAGNQALATAAYFSADSSGYAGIVSGVSLSTPATIAAPGGKVTYTCGSVSGKGAIAVKYTNTDGTVVTSNSLNVTCSGAPVTYTAKYDKSTYKPGDIATLTVTFKDSKGNLANDVDTITSWATTKYATPAITTAGLTAISGPTSTDALSNGVIEYKYSVGLSTGTFTNSVDYPSVDTDAKTAGLTPGPVSATLTIADGATSLNDVLKGIVSLIASINKQIAALAKLVTKKK